VSVSSRTAEQALVEPAFLPVFTSDLGEARVMRAYDAVMAAWPAAHDDLLVPTRYGLTHVIASGPANGRPLVLLHALMATATSWYRAVEWLAGDHRVYAVDVLGEPGKSRPTRPMKSLDDFFDWFTQLIDALGIDDMAVVGNSFGGFTGATYAMRMPDRVRKLVLVAPAMTIHRIPAFYLNMLVPKAAYLFFPWLPGQRRVMRRAIDWMLNGLPADPRWVPLFYRVMLHGAMTNQLFPRLYTADELAHIQADVLLIVGTKERVYDPRAAIRSARRLMPRLEVDLVPEAHHIAALAQPERVSRRILEFVDRP
jgi:pimeloyl-ACP methyl ester carboxylesterase